MISGWRKRIASEYVKCLIELPSLKEELAPQSVGQLNSRRDCLMVSALEYSRSHNLWDLDWLHLYDSRGMY